MPLTEVKYPHTVIARIGDNELKKLKIYMRQKKIKTMAIAIRQLIDPPPAKEKKPS